MSVAGELREHDAAMPVSQGVRKLVEKDMCVC
jgi:hypothetical protein